MAKVTYGALITEINGSIGGITFQTNRAGTIARLRPSTFRSRTGKQNTEISNFTSLIRGFSELSLADKNDWDAFANAHTKETKFGETRTLTGQNWYTAINAQREKLSLARLDTPPMFQQPIGNANFSLVVDATKIEVTKNPPSSPNDTSLIFWATAPVMRTTTSLRSELRLIAVIQTQPFTVIDLTTFWELAFGCNWPPSDPIADLNIFVGLQLVRESSGLTTALNIQGEALVQEPEGVGFQIVGSTNVIG